MELQTMNQPAKSISKVFLAFLLSSESRQGGCRGLLKRCIRRVGGQVVHVEPVFLFDDGDVISVVVNIDEKVEFWKRDGQVHYNTAYWDCVGLAMSPEERVRMYHFCVEQNGKPYVLFWFFFVIANYFCFQIQQAWLVLQFSTRATRLLWHSG